MGTGNKLEASMLEVADISKTSVCPLARVMRYELKKRGITHLKVVYSKEEPKIEINNIETEMSVEQSKSEIEIQNSKNTTSIKLPKTGM